MSQIVNKGRVPRGTPNQAAQTADLPASVLDASTVSQEEGQRRVTLPYIPEPTPGAAAATEPMPIVAPMLRASAPLIHLGHADTRQRHELPMEGNPLDVKADAPAEAATAQTATARAAAVLAATARAATAEAATAEAATAEAASVHIQMREVPAEAVLPVDGGGGMKLRLAALEERVGAMDRRLAALAKSLNDAAQPTASAQPTADVQPAKANVQPKASVQPNANAQPTASDQPKASAQSAEKTTEAPKPRKRKGGTAGKSKATEPV